MTSRRTGSALRRCFTPCSISDADRGIRIDKYNAAKERDGTDQKLAAGFWAPRHSDCHSNNRPDGCCDGLSSDSVLRPSVPELSVNHWFDSWFFFPGPACGGADLGACIR